MRRGKPTSSLNPRGCVLRPYSLSFFLFAFSPLRLFPILLFAFSPFALFPPSSLAATVAVVLDGDTIQLVDGTKVRYLGVNAPEHGQPFAAEAKRYNEQLVLGKDVRLETSGQERDAYHRVLAYVYVGDVLVNARLIAEGLGHLFVIGSLDRYNEWLQLQRDARAQHKGMWRIGGVSGPLKITTVHADAEAGAPLAARAPLAAGAPLAGDDRRNPNGEYVRICNVSDRPVALQGFSIQDTAHHRYVFSTGTLNPGYTALLLSGRGNNRVHRKQLLFYWSSGPIWNNDGDMASLSDRNGKLIDSFRVQGHERKDEE